MVKITVNRENFKIDERELEQGSLSIGRKHDNALIIDDPAISSHHAQIVTVFDSSYVEDLGSTNGTFVNGKKINTHTLHNGDVLTIGHYQILFQSETVTTARAANATMMIGASHLEELTKKPGPKASTEVSAHKNPQPAPPVNAVKPEVCENNGQPVSGRAELPDIGDDVNILGQTQPVPPSPPPLHNRRKGDNSPLPSLKVIALAMLVTIITFTLLMLIFK